MSESRARDVELQEQQTFIDQQTTELINLRAGHDIDRQALESLRKSVAGMDEQLSAQEEELMLYGKLLKVGNVDEGLHILNISIERGEEPRSFIYSFVIRQQAASLKMLSANYSGQIKGHQKGEVVSYSLAELDNREGSSTGKTKLKYFSLIEGEITLPEQFVPISLEISAWPQQSPAQRRELTIDWPGAGT